MTEFEWLALFEMLILVTSAIHDIREHRIPNLLIIFGLFSGLMQQYINNGMMGLLTGAVLGTAATLIFSPLYILKVLGAGDIKLLSVLSIYLGMEKTLQTFFCIFLIGASYSLIKLLIYGNFTGRVRYLFQYVQSVITTGQFAEYDLQEKREQLIIPMAVPICLGGILYVGGLL